MIIGGDKQTRLDPRQSRSRGAASESLSSLHTTSLHSFSLFPNTADSIGTSSLSLSTLHTPYSEEKFVEREGRGEMVRIIPMATSLRPSLSSFRFSTSRFGFPLSFFNPSRTVASLSVGSGESSFHALHLFSILPFVCLCCLIGNGDSVFSSSFFCWIFMDKNSYVLPNSSWKKKGIRLQEG